MNLNDITLELILDRSEAGKEIISKFFSKKTYYSSQNTLSVDNLVEKYINTLIRERKSIVKNLNLLKDAQLTTIIDEVIKHILLKAQNINGKYSTYFKKVDHIKCVVSLYELSKKVDYLPSIKNLKVEDFENFFTKLNSNLIDEYISLYKKGLVKNINNLYERCDGQNFIVNKKSFNSLVEILLLDHSSHCLDKIIDISRLLKTGDPSFADLKRINLLNEVNQGNYSLEQKEKINELLSQEISPFEVIQNTFKIVCDVDNLQLLLKKESFKTNANVLIEKFHQFLEYAKKENLIYCDSYQSVENQVMTVMHHTNINLKGSRALTEMIKYFEFTYDDQQDKDIKKEIFSCFMKEAINNYKEKSTVENEELKKLFQNVVINFKLKSTFPVENLEKNKKAKL